MSINLALMLMLSAAQAEPDERACGMFSQDVYSAGNASSGCELKRAGEKPLWQKQKMMTADDHQIFRLVFSSGRDGSFRFVTLGKHADGKAYMISGGLDVQYRMPRKRWLRQKNAISLAQWDEVSRLAATSGTFDHAIGTWDGDEIYMHCQSLSLEHVDLEGYRFSSVTIGCNRPEKLVPLVDKVISLTNRQRLFAGWVPK